MQSALDGILENFPRRVMAWLLRRIVFPLGKTFSPPSDELGRQVSSLLLAPSATRDRLTAGIYVPVNEADPVGRLDIALQSTLAAEAIEAKIHAASKAGHIKGKTFEETTAQAVQLNIISAAEMELLAKAKALRRDVIMVDDFPPDFGKGVSAKGGITQKEMLSTGRKTA
jgi:acyl-CoA dehydrogenase